MKATIKTASVCCAGIAFIVTLVLQYSVLTDYYRIDDDVMQHAFWMREWRIDLTKDIVAQYSIQSSPFSVRLLFRVIALLIDPVIFTKLFTLVAAPLAVCIVSYTAGLFGGWLGGIFAGILMLLHISWRDQFWFGVGNAGDIGPLLFVIFIAGFLAKREGSLPMLLVFLAAVYPPLFLLAGVILAIGIAFDWLRVKQIRKWLLTMSIAGICTIYILYAYAGASPYGAMATREQIQSMAEFGEQGRIPLHFSSFTQNLMNSRSGFCLTHSTLFLITIFGLLCLITGKAGKMFPGRARVVLLSSILLYSIARACMLSLYEPSRFIKFSLPLLLIFGIARGVAELLAMKRNTFFSMLLLCLITTGAISTYSGNIGHTTKAFEMPELLRAIAQTPPESVIVGHPLDLDFVPLFSHRRILFSHELAMPYRPAYYEVLKKRMIDFFIAYFAEDEASVRSYLRQSGATHIIINRYHFTQAYKDNGERGMNPRYGRYFFEPFNSIIKPFVSRSQFFWSSEPTVGVIYSDSRYYLVSIKEFLAD